jgi:hypothetical protein
LFFFRISVGDKMIHFVHFVHFVFFQNIGGGQNLFCIFNKISTEIDDKIDRSLFSYITLSLPNKYS